MAKRKKVPRSTSMNMVVNNYDLLMEILIRLPAKPVTRFKSVSKQWQSIISTPSFHTRRALHHNSRRPKPPTSFILEEQYSEVLFLLAAKKITPFNIGLKGVEILQSCNGLLLLRRSTVDFYVCNPTTRQIRKLSLKQSSSRLGLVFDPSKSAHYKVVCFRTKYSSYWVDIYDSETHTWKKGAELPYLLNSFRNAVYWNDDIYYIRPRSASRRFVLNDKFYEIPSPPLICDRVPRKSHVMESNGHLHCVALPRRPDKDPLVVSEMDKTNLTWSEKYCVVFPDFSSSFYRRGQAIDVLGVIRGEKEEDSMLLFGLPGKVMLYNFFDETFEEVVRTGEESRRFVGCHQFIETLVPV